MDLRLGAAAQATDEEQAAVSSVLGPPETGWDGGQRTAADGHAAYGGHAARARRHLLLPVLHAVQERIGWIRPGALDHVCARLTTGRRLDSFNTGVQSGHYATPLRRPETLDLSPEDADRLGLAEGEVAKVSSRRGSLEVPVHIDEVLRAGLAFMTLHFPDQVATNVLTLDAWDPKSGTAEFKATAIRVDKLGAPGPARAETKGAEAST